MRLEGKVALITGGGSGIGRASAKLFAKEGAQVVVVDYQTEGAQTTVNEIQASNQEAMVITADVSESFQVDRMVQAALDTYGHIDILFNNAGILTFGTVLETELETWNRVMSVNLTGVFLCAKAVIPHMIKQGGGSIINASSSTGAHDANGSLAAYVSSKGGVTLLTKAMAIDHAQDNIRVNAIAPGPTDTQMLRDNLTLEEQKSFAETFPMQRFGQAEELAQAALFLASDEASFVTGAIFAVDGGQTAQV